VYGATFPHTVLKVKLESCAVLAALIKYVNAFLLINNSSVFPAM